MNQSSSVRAPLFRTASFTLAVNAKENEGDRSGGISGSSRGRNSDRSPGSRSIWISVVGSIGAIMFAVFCLCKRRKRSRNKFLFEEAVRKAKSDVKQRSRAALSHKQMTVPHSGEYTTKLLSGGTKRNGSITLAFHNNGSDGYYLYGKGIDNDGCTIITEGHANYDGMVWWKEEYMTGNVDMQVLSTGEFAFTERTFTGEWLNSAMVDGTYASFFANESSASSLPESNMSQ